MAGERSRAAWSCYFKSETYLVPLLKGWVYSEGGLYMGAATPQNLPDSSDWQTELWAAVAKDAFPHIQKGKLGPGASHIVLLVSEAKSCGA